jgi:hypothetical protein
MINPMRFVIAFSVPCSETFPGRGTETDARLRLPRCPIGGAPHGRRVMMHYSALMHSSKSGVLRECVVGFA